MQTSWQPALHPPVHDGDHTQGPADAPVTLVEYGDYQCPYCAQAHPMVQAMQRRFGDRLRFVFRNFPLTEIHPDALHAAEAAESAAAQGGQKVFWAMHDTIFAHQRRPDHALDDAHLAQYAASAGANGEQVLADLAAGAFEEKVHADFMTGVRSGVNGTPTFFINGARFEGDWSVAENLAAALEAA